MRTFALQCPLRKDFGGRLALFLCLAALALAARADDPPGHRAARLSYLQGNVTADHLDNTAGDPAQINMPLVEGSRLTTGEDGQAEVEFEDGSVVRVTPNSSLGLNALTVDSAGNFHTQLTVQHGLVYAELRAAARFTYTVDAGGELISPVANATIRINLDQPPATVSVFDGAVHIEQASSPEADGYKTDVRAGETLTGDSSDSSRYFLSPGIEPDSWDTWNQGRDQAAAEAAADRTAARDTFAGDQGYGWSDLDSNGNWYEVPGQGQVWQPTIAQDTDFDPYGYGNWVVYPGTGYVWASGYEWGWTPFRCGRWSYWDSFGWGWSPGVACRSAGWRFGGGAFAFNVVRTPLGYRLPTLPVHRPGTFNSIQVGRPVQDPGREVHPSQEPRFIAGAQVEPLRPINSPSTMKNRSEVGAALRNDFAVDHASRQPVVGVVGAASSVAPRTDLRPGMPRYVTPPAAAYGTEPQMRPAPSPPRSSYPAQTSGEHSATRAYTPAYAPRSAPPPSSPPPPSRGAPAPPAPATPKK
jgi:hypothetical protein